ncbi:MAG: hypothetical protein IT567_06655 [Alphaproteobacteria bacterium]|nr:hypothetical protein [Alphaproteobacteria bacterium]
MNWWELSFWLKILFPDDKKEIEEVDRAVRQYNAWEQFFKDYPVVGRFLLILLIIVACLAIAFGAWLGGGFSLLN